jgi:hypothetical protein
MTNNETHRPAADLTAGDRITVPATALPYTYLGQDAEWPAGTYTVRSVRPVGYTGAVAIQTAEGPSIRSGATMLIRLADDDVTAAIARLPRVDAAAAFDGDFDGEFAVLTF